MLLYPGYVSENPAGNKIRYKTDLTPGVNINSRKASVASVNRAGETWGHSEPLSRGFGKI